MKYAMLAIVALICSGLQAGEMNPVQKSTVTPQGSPVQKTTPMGTPTQKSTPMATPTQKSTPVVPHGSPVQKTTPMGSPVQKGTYSMGETVQLTAEEQCILDRIRALEGRPFAQAIAKRCLARRLRQRMPFPQNTMYAPEYIGELTFDEPQVLVRAPFTRVEVRRRY